MINHLFYNILFFATIGLFSCTEAYQNDYQEELEDEDTDLSTENDTASRATQTQFYFENQTDESFAIQIANYLQHELACFTVGYPDTYHKVFFLVLKTREGNLPYDYILAKAKDAENTVYSYQYIEGPQNYPVDGNSKPSNFICHDLKLNDLDRDGIKELVHISEVQLGAERKNRFIISIFDDEPTGYSYSQRLTNRYLSYYKQNEMLNLFKETDQPMTLTATSNISRNLRALEGRIYHMVKMKGDRLICCNCQDYSLTVNQDGTGDYFFVLSEGNSKREFKVDSIKLKPGTDNIVYYGRDQEKDDQTVNIDRAMKNDLDMITYGNEFNYILSDDINKIEINPEDCPE